MELTVIVPCLNEAGNLPELVRRVGEVFRTGQLLAEDGGRGAELLLIDDGSTDDSPAVMAELCSRYSFLRSIRHPRNQGIAAGWKTGALAARGHLVCLIDADLQYQPEDILRLRSELLWSNVDVVQGWRSPVGRERGPRYYYSRGLNVLLNACFGMRARDNKSGFILCAREVLLDLLDHRGHYAYWQSFILVAAHHKGYTYKEVETLFENRKAGVSFLQHPFKPILRTFVDLGRGLYEYRIRPARSSDLKPLLDNHRPLDRTPARTPAQSAYLSGYLLTFGATHWMMTRDVGTHLRDLSRSQWLPPAAVRELQEHKLRRLVQHAYQHVPYYRHRLRQQGVAPEDIHTLDDLRKLPVLSKDDVRRHTYFDILSDNHDRAEILRVTTSGSTGEPFVCFVDRTQLEFRWAATLRSQEWTGYRFGDRSMRLWHQALGMSRSQAIRERLDAFISRRRFIPAYEMSEHNLAALCAEIAAYKPLLIDGYTESLTLLAEYMKRSGAQAGKGILGIMTSAQNLPVESRRLIESAFLCPVFDKYGSREFSGIAYECEAHAGHHVVAEGYIVEILKDGRPALPGEVGEIVITDLNNYCLPFIRYRIGDLGEAMDADALCPCGRGLPRIGNIEGRVQSIIQGEKGRYLPGSFFAYLLKDYAHAIRHFQVMQEEAGAIALRIVKGERYTDESLNQVLGTLQHFLGASMRIEVEFLDAIPMVRTGKRLAAVSKLSIDFQNLPKSV